MRFLWFLCLCIAAFGQQTGSIVGTIVDKSGDPVSGATVTVNQQFRPGSPLHCHQQRLHMFDKLAPGTYQVRAVATAMRAYLAKGIIVNPGKTARLDITLLLPDANLGTLGEEDRFPKCFGPWPRARDTASGRRQRTHKSRTADWAKTSIQQMVDHMERSQMRIDPRSLPVSKTPQIP